MINLIDFEKPQKILEKNGEIKKKNQPIFSKNSFKIEGGFVSHMLLKDSHSRLKTCFKNGFSCLKSQNKVFNSFFIFSLMKNNN